jgi:hypothetical protein
MKRIQIDEMSIAAWSEGGEIHSICDKKNNLEMNKGMGEVGNFSWKFHPE